MNRILAVFDELRYAESTAIYAVELAKETEAHVVGLFVEDLIYPSMKVFEPEEYNYLDIAKRKTLAAQHADIRKRAANRFSEYCKKHQVTYSIHQDNHISISKLFIESAYTDLVVIGSNESIIHYSENAPSALVRDLLSNVRCAVLTVPPSYKPITRIGFLYDGSISSVHSIRYFSYLFPSKRNTPIDIIRVHSRKETNISGKGLLSEIVKDHFSDINYINLDGIPEIAIVAELQNSNYNYLLVLGAYNRTNLSRWWKGSIADKLMSSVSVPMFIAK